MGRNSLKTGVAAAAFFWASGAIAADMAPVRKAVGYSTDYGWSGFYLGLNSGYALGADPTRFIQQSPSDATFGGRDRFDLAARGGFFGVQGGVNWQLAPHWLAGLEADVQSLSSTDRACVGTCNLFKSGYVAIVNQKLSWFGTLRGRIGGIAGSTLYYATAGLAYAHAEHSGTIEITRQVVPGPVPFSTGGTTSGLALGAGAESRLSSNWSLKVEYLYLRLGSLSAGTIIQQTDPDTLTHEYSSDIRAHIFRAGLNYQLGSRTAQYASGSPAVFKAPPPVPRVHDWAGLYVGANAGYGAASSATSTSLNNPGGFSGVYASDSFNMSPEGAIGGGQIGYNWHLIPHAVFGLEADIQASGLRADTCTSSCNAPHSFGNSSLALEQRIPWFGTARARLGWTHHQALFFATGGLASAAVQTAATATFSADGATISGTQQFNNRKVGWTVGGGIETAFDHHWSIKAEYLYVDLGRTGDGFSVNTTPLAFFAAPTSVTYASDLRLHVFRIGANYRFGGPSSPRGSL